MSKFNFESNIIPKCFSIEVTLTMLLLNIRQGDFLWGFATEYHLFRLFYWIRIKTHFPLAELLSTTKNCDVSSAHDKCWPFNTTLCFLQFKKYFFRVISSSDIPFCSNLKSKPSCQTLSNALDTSRKTPLTSWPSSNAERISCVIDSNWFVQESPGLKPDCLGDIKSFSEKNIWKYVILE